MSVTTDITRTGQQIQLYDGNNAINISPVPKSVYWFSQDGTILYIRGVEIPSALQTVIELPLANVTVNGVKPADAAAADAALYPVFN